MFAHDRVRQGQPRRTDLSCRIPRAPRICVTPPGVGAIPVAARRECPRANQAPHIGTPTMSTADTGAGPMQLSLWPSAAAGASAWPHGCSLGLSELHPRTLKPPIDRERRVQLWAERRRPRWSSTWGICGERGAVPPTRHRHEVQTSAQVRVRFHRSARRFDPTAPAESPHNRSRPDLALLLVTASSFGRADRI